MKTLIFILFALSPALSLASAGYYGDVTILESKPKSFIIEQAGYKLLINKQKLPKDILALWEKNKGKTFVSTVPYVAVSKQIKLKASKRKLPQHR